MKINKRLNLVLPIYDPSTFEKDEATGKTEEIEHVRCHVFSTPLQRETFDRYYMVIGQAFNTIMTKNLEFIGGAKLAYHVVRDIAVKSGEWEGDEGVENGLINEILRLTNVFAPSPRGWTMIPFEDACAGGILDEDDAAEVRNACVFFTLMSTMVRKDEVAGALRIPLRVWSARLESLSSTEFMNSLPTSKGTVSSTARTPEGLSVPS